MPVKDRLLFAIGLPLFLVGYLPNIIPLWLALKITEAKVKHIEFYSSVLMVTGMVLYLLYLLGLTIFAFCYSFNAGVFVFFLVPVLGYGALLYCDAWVLTLNRLECRSMQN